MLLLLSLLQLQERKYVQQEQYLLSLYRYIRLLYRCMLYIRYLCKWEQLQRLHSMYELLFLFHHSLLYMSDSEYCFRRHRLMCKHQTRYAQAWEYLRPLLYSHMRYSTRMHRNRLLYKWLPLQLPEQEYFYGLLREL